MACTTSRRWGPAGLNARPTSSADAGPVLKHPPPQPLCERRVTDDVLQLELRGIEQLQPQVIVAIRAVQDQARGEEAKLVRRGGGVVDVAYAHEVDVRVDDVDMLREQVAHRPLQAGLGFLVPTPEPQEAKCARLVEPGRNGISLKRSRLGARVDREPGVRIDVLEALA